MGHFNRKYESVYSSRSSEATKLQRNIIKINLNVSVIGGCDCKNLTTYRNAETSFGK